MSAIAGGRYVWGRFVPLRMALNCGSSTASASAGGTDWKSTSESFAESPLSLICFADCTTSRPTYMMSKLVSSSRVVLTPEQANH